MIGMCATEIVLGEQDDLSTGSYPDLPNLLYYIRRVAAYEPRKLTFSVRISFFPSSCSAGLPFAGPLI